MSRVSHRWSCPAAWAPQDLEKNSVSLLRGYTCRPPRQTNNSCDAYRIDTALELRRNCVRGVLQGDDPAPAAIASQKFYNHLGGSFSPSHGVWLQPPSQ